MKQVKILLMFAFQLALLALVAGIAHQLNVGGSPKALFNVGVFCLSVKTFLEFVEE